MSSQQMFMVEEVDTTSEHAVWAWLKMILVLVCLAGAGWGGYEGWRALQVTLEIGKLKNADPKVRAHAAEQLGQSNNARAVEPLIAALHDWSQDVEKSAAAALGQLHDPRAMEPLIADMGNADFEVAEAAATALGESKDARALPRLMAMLRDKDGNAAAGTALVALGAPSVEPLMELLHDPDPALQQQAAELLGLIRDPHALDALIAVMNQPAAVAQDAANPTAAETKAEYDRTALAAIAAKALGEIGDPRAVDALIAKQKDADAATRDNAAEALGAIGDARASSYLMDALEQHDNRVIAAAYAFYVRRGQEGTEAALIEALEKNGGEEMATEFMNSGNPKLKDAADQWAFAHGYEIMYRPASKQRGWGGKR